MIMTRRFGKSDTPSDLISGSGYRNDENRRPTVVILPKLVGKIVMVVVGDELKTDEDNYTSLVRQQNCAIYQGRRRNCCDS